MRRTPPHKPLLFDCFPVHPQMSDGELVAAFSASPDHLPLVPHQGGLVEMGHAGAGGMLIAADVFRTLPPPWFEFGRFGANGAGEDTWFTLCARRAGFKVWCDLDTPIGHLTTAALWAAPVDAHGQIAALCEFSFDGQTLHAHKRSTPASSR